MSAASKASFQPIDEASSSSDEDSNDSPDASSVENTRLINSIDDLPSDDSVSLDSNNTDSDTDTDTEDHDEHDEHDEHDSQGDNNNDGPFLGFLNNNYGKDTQELSLAETLELKNDDGDRALKERRGRRTAAIAKAKNLLKQTKESSEHPKKQQQQQQSRKPNNEIIKKSKHAPTEVSSKRKDYFQRGALQLNSAGIGIEIGAHRYKPRDPRMSSMSGRLQEEHFEHHYGFLQDVRKEEIATLERRIKARDIPGKKGQRLRQRLGLTSSATAPSLDEDKRQLQLLKQQSAQYLKNQVERAAKQSVKRKIRDEVESGARGAYFMKRSEKKQMELEARFEELSKRGDLTKALVKKRKKNKSKDASRMK